jgi:hypothetical protein
VKLPLEPTSEDGSASDRLQHLTDILEGWAELDERSQTG